MHLQRADASYFLRLITKTDDGGFWTLHKNGLNPPRPGAAIVMDPAAEGFAASATWAVRCPFCPSAQLGNPATQARFCCVNCGNNTIGSRWARVRWPDNIDDIEAALLRRVLPQQMNWMSHESLEHLHAENIEHGIGTIADVPKDLRRLVQALVDAGHEVTPVHAIAPGTIVHPDSEWHPAKTMRLIEALGANFDEDDIRRALVVHGQGR